MEYIATGFCRGLLYKKEGKILDDFKKDRPVRAVKHDAQVSLEEAEQVQERILI